MPDQADRWRLIETLFHRASALPADERGAFLNRECDGDPGLRRAIEDLIAADSESAIIEQAIAGMTLNSSNSPSPARFGKGFIFRLLDVRPRIYMRPFEPVCDEFTTSPSLDERFL